MSIRELFSSNWKDIQGVVGGIYPTPRHKTAIFQRSVGEYMLGECVVMCDDTTGDADLVTVRYPHAWLALGAWLHFREQSKRLEREGIQWRIHQEGGVVTCTYSYADFLDRVSDSGS